MRMLGNLTECLLSSHSMSNQQGEEEQGARLGGTGGKETEAGWRAGRCRETSLASLNLQNQSCRWGLARAQHRADVSSSH